MTLLLLLFFSLGPWAVPAHALDIELRVTPSVLIPLGTDSTENFSVGGGASLNADIQFWNLLGVGPEGGYYIAPVLNAGTYFQFITGGLGLNLFAFPLSRLSLNLGASGGAYYVLFASDEDHDYSSLWYKGFGGIGLRISPQFTLSASAGYICFYGDSAPLFTGLTAGLTAHISLSTTAAAGNLAISLDQTEPVFPLLYGVYKQNPIGTLHIVNNESAEIRNVSVSFQAGSYTASLMPCGSVDILQKRKAVDIPLYADFSDQIQNFTENGKIPGELVIEYEILGSKRHVAQTLVIDVYNRNSVRWIDPSALAAYISPNSPEVLDYSKYIVGIARDRLRTGLNRNMQFAMYLFEGLKIGGVSYSNDDATPYIEFHKDPSLLDYVQYPFQTLSYKLGDYDDLGILYAACLESVGIKAAVIPLDNDFLVAFSLNISPADAEALFNDTGLLLTIGEEIWMPLSFSVLREGFVNAWYKGITNLTDAVSAGQELHFILLQDAWRSYPPSGITGSETPFQKPLEETVVRAVETDLMRYITTEFGPKIKAIQDEIRAGGGTAALYNRLGTLYVRAGMYNEAKGEYLRAADMGSVSAMVNLGNIAVLQDDSAAAEQWYRKALAAQPDNRAAQTGLDRVLADTE